MSDDISSLFARCSLSLHQPGLFASAIRCSWRPESPTALGLRDLVLRDFGSLTDVPNVKTPGSFYPGFLEGGSDRRRSGDLSIFRDAREPWTAVVELPSHDGKRRRKVIRSKDQRKSLISSAICQQHPSPLNNGWTIGSSTSHPNVSDPTLRPGIGHSSRSRTFRKSAAFDSTSSTQIMCGRFTTG